MPTLASGSGITPLIAAMLRWERRLLIGDAECPSCPDAYATHGGSRWRLGDELCEPAEVLGDRRERELVLCAAWASQTKPAEPQDTLQVREPHLDALAVVPRPFERVGAGKRSSHVSRARFVDAARNPAKRLPWGQHPGLSWHVAQSVKQAAAREQRIPCVYLPPRRRQRLPSRAHISVRALVVAEVLT